MKWKQYLAVMTAAAMVISGPAVPMSQVFAADAVAAEGQADEETVYELPADSSTLTVEAENFTMHPLNGDTKNHVHVEDASWASGGKIANWFENGDAISMKFNAPEAGEYSVTATYRSGRTEGGTPNAFVWEGTNIESGSVDVYGEQNATTTHTVTFTVKVTKAGQGELRFTATTPKVGPQVDKFEFKKKANVAVSDVTLDKETAVLNKKGQTVQLTATVAPTDASNKNVSFASSDTKVATVDAKTGKVTAVANGIANITVTTEDGSKTAVCTVTVDIKDTTETEDAEAPKTWGATPNDEQLWYMKQGTAAFCHFGPNTFNNVEWGENYGTKSPAEIFTLSDDFDAEELVKTVKEAGFSRLMLTAKHHDGFCLWASDYTDYDIASTNYKGGKGDILEEISDACTKYNLDMGLYLSPWDIHEDKYGCFGDNNNTKSNEGKGEFTDYNKLYTTWIREICTAKKADGSYKYGNNNPNRRSDRFVEWWMDGAQGSGSHVQTYDWTAIFSAIRDTNPSCQIFGTHAAVKGINASDKALASTGGIHWIGNENGIAADETWAKVDAGTSYENTTLYPRVDGAIVGKADGDQWSVPEVDTKMLAGWFWRDAAGDNTSKSEKELADIYFRTVGHGAALLLNLSPNKKGTIGTEQLNRFKEFGNNIKETFKNDLTKVSGVTATADSTWKDSDKYGAANVLDTIPNGETYDNTYWAPAEGKTTGSLEINLGGVKKFDVVSIEEYIQKGQTISSFTVEYKDITGRWHDFASGKTISSKRLCRGETVEGTAVRINITGAKDTPKICNVGVFKAAKGFEVASSGSDASLPSNLKKVSINDATREGTWNFEADEDGNAKSSAWGDTAGLAATFTFTGTKAWVVGTADPNHGMMDVYIDGEKVDSVNTQQSPRKMGAILYTTPDLEYGTHTIKLARVTKALGISKIWYADGSGIFTMKQSEYDLMYGGTTEVEITRTGGSKGEVTVTYSTQSAGAEQGVNYTDLAGTVTFKDGETSKKITLTGLENENPDRMIDGKDFYFTLMASDNGSIGNDSYAHVVLYNADVTKVAERIEAMDLTGYTAESVKVLNDAMSEMKALGTTATKDQIKAAVKKVLDAKNALRAASENNPAYEAVTGVSLDKTTAKLTEKGQTVELKATVAPATASIKDVNFATSNAAVATVDANGKVTAVANGTATITVTTEDGSKTATCTVTVEIPKTPDPTPTPVPADLVEKVNNEIAAAADKKETDYTADSWKNYQKALEAATKVAKDEKATKADLEKVLADLQTAAAKLQKKAPESETPSTDSKNPTVGTEAKVGKGIYRVTNAKKKTVVLVKARKANNTSFNVPKSVKLADGRYKVVGIAKNAFKNNKKLKKVVIGSQVTKIGANAFSGAKNLKTITIKSKSLKSVGKNAFKGIHKNCKIKVPAKKLNSYKKLLSKKGQKNSVKITK
ncbi:Kappa-carrageenase precursor [uncultured Ruminococcus sp.]|nr:Kappa-carrageenase precursor [uncultured Ruminococcus sp.]